MCTTLGPFSLRETYNQSENIMILYVRQIALVNLLMCVPAHAIVRFSGNIVKRGNWAVIELCTQLNHLGSLTKWLSACLQLQTKWLWVQILLASLKLQIQHLFQARSPLTSGKLYVVDLFWNLCMTSQ